MEKYKTKNNNQKYNRAGNLNSNSYQERDKNKSNN